MFAFFRGGNPRSVRSVLAGTSPPQSTFRRSHFEMLEGRQLLVCPGPDCPDDETVETETPNDPSPVGEAAVEITAGDTAKQFTYN